MPFVPMKELLMDAKRRGYAVGGFNVFNMESVQAVISAAEKEAAPVIIMGEQRDVGYAGMDYLYHVALAATEKTSVPVAFHLDHGISIDVVKRAVERGFSSVMIDRSFAPLEENIAVTQEVIAMARRASVSVEAELGHVGGAGAEAGQGDASIYTDPQEALVFVQETGVDALAVAIGTAHGVYVETPKLDLERLAQISRLVDIPLVLHGGSGTPDDDLCRAIELGVCKINVGTDIRRRFVSEVVKAGNDGKSDVRDVLTAGRNAMEEVIIDRIQVFGASGKA
jgi:fructose-bisphosphate aldolase class II